MTVHVATLHTANFEFTAIGASRRHALRIMRNTWNVHRQQTDAEYTWNELRDDVNVEKMTTGQGYRYGDSSALYSEPPTEPATVETETLIDLLSRAWSVISTDDAADEHAELISELHNAWLALKEGK